jgi:hypothetical protein
MFYIRCRAFNAINRSDEVDALVVVKNKHNFVYWCLSDPSIRDQVTYEGLEEYGLVVKALFNPTIKEIARYKSKNSSLLVFYNPHHYWFGEKKEKDYIAKLCSEVEALESLIGAGAVFPPSKSIVFWENKGYLHDVMREKLIRHPLSYRVTGGRLEEERKLDYPFIVKSLDGYSSNGIWKLNSHEEVLRWVSKNAFIDAEYIIQEFLNISFDIRIICSYGHVVSFYWRLNNGIPDGTRPTPHQWRPTATQNGSTVMFKQLPESVRLLGRQIYEKTDLSLFGADICFKDDDTSSKPFVLEFSPVFQPNPVPPKGIITSSYGRFKSKSQFLSYEIRFRKLSSFIFKTCLVGIIARIGIKKDN